MIPGAKNPWPFDFLGVCFFVQLAFPSRVWTFSVLDPIQTDLLPSISDHFAAATCIDRSRWFAEAAAGVAQTHDRAFALGPLKPGSRRVVFGRLLPEGRLESGDEVCARQQRDRRWYGISSPVRPDGI